MSAIKLTRAVFLARNLNKNAGEVIKVVSQQKQCLKQYSSYLVNTNRSVLQNPKFAAITLTNYYSTEKGKVPGVFQSIGNSLNADMVKKVNSVYQFELSGEEAGKWFLDLKTEGGKCGTGDAPQPADCVLTMDSKNFVKMFDGKLKPTTAYMTGKLKIKGNLQVALKLDKFMSELKAKAK